MNEQKQLALDTAKKRLDQMGVFYRELMNGQLQVDTVNYWATSEKWHDAAAGKSGKGFNGFIAHLKAQGIVGDLLEQEKEMEKRSGRPTFSEKEMLQTIIAYPRKRFVHVTTGNRVYFDSNPAHRNQIELMEYVTVTQLVIPFAVKFDTQLMHVQGHQEWREEG